MAQPPAPAPNQNKPRLGEMLMRDGLITQEQLNRALEEQRAFGGRLGRHLVDLGFLNDNALLDALSRQLRIPRIELEAPGIVAADASRYARADLCEQWGFCPITYDQKRAILIVAVSDPDPQLLVDLEGFLAMRVEPRIAPAEVIERVVRRMFHGDGSGIKRMAGLQISRGEAKNANGAMDALSLNAPPAPPPAAPLAVVPPPVNPYDAQIAQQVALQMQQQMQMQQLQLQAQQVAARQAAAQQAAAQAAAQQAAAQAAQQQAAAQAAAQQAGAQAAQQAAVQAAAQQAAYQNGMAPAPAYANGYAGPGATFGFSMPPKPMPNGMPMMPPSQAAPVSGPSLEELQEQLNRLEKTLSAQARALRSLVEVLVEKGVLTKVEMARKQQNNAK